MLFEGICAKALLQSQKEALQGLGHNAHMYPKPPKMPVPAAKKVGPAIAFGLSDAKTSRRIGEYVYAGELRFQDYALLQNVLSRARLPQGCGTSIQMESLKRLFVAKRTPAGSILQLDGFCDGILSLSRMILECLRGGNTEEVPAPKSSPDLEGVPWSLELKPKGLTDLSHVFHRLVGRLIIIYLSLS